MILRLPLLALAGTLTLAGAQAHAADRHGADLQAIDSYLAITGTGTASTPAGRPATDRLAPHDARIVALGEGSAIVYYTVDGRSPAWVRVVTTVRTDADGAVPSTRFVSYLAAG